MSILVSCLVIVLAPLLASILAGFAPNQLGREGAHTITIAAVGMSLLFALYVAWHVLYYGAPYVNANLYTWADGGISSNYAFHIGFLIDPLVSVMMVIVTFVSLLVHIYSIGYMEEDEGYQRFFSYISLFTFMMLMLVTSNNFLQLFFGWEGVGLVSYLLIGFWYKKESALQGSLKAFIVNRVGDFGFILGIGLLLATVGSIDYTDVFKAVPDITHASVQLFSGTSWSLVTVISVLLFIGAMGKSAQVPLHVWLPESMEGPTPISALIHAATMVTAGVFMIARISPLIEYSQAALSLVLVVGATGALFTGLIAVVMTDIKRVVAYSTLSQLGYMMVAMGTSAFSAGIFHLLTHACFKALLFLGAGSVIIGMHHEQDMTKMGGLWSKMPITYVTFLIGSLALCAIPPFSGFFSKDTIIEAAGLSTIPGSYYAYVCVSLGAMVTAIYTFRAFFMTFHGTPRMSKERYEHIHESPWVVWFPLVALAIPSVVIGYLLYDTMVLQQNGLLAPSLFILPEHNVLATLAHEIHSPWQAMVHALTSVVFGLTLIGIFVTWLLYCVFPAIPARIAAFSGVFYTILLQKFGFDSLYDRVFVQGGISLGKFFSDVIDHLIIDGFFVNGFARFWGWLSGEVRLAQSGYVYHYVGLMVLGLLFFLCWLMWF